MWFDDLKVTHTATFVAQATDYGAWGDVLREQRTDERKYRFGYQGQFAEKDDETGWNHFELREYDGVIGRWLVVDPMRQYFSPYRAFGSNPISRVDANGGFDDYYIYSDGTIEVVPTGPVDNFFYVDADNNITPLATGWERNENGLLHLPLSFCFEGNGLSFAFSVKAINHENAYINPNAMASLFGAFVETGYSDFTIVHFSDCAGRSPHPSVSHINGINGDIRYLRTDMTGAGVKVSDEAFDLGRNARFTEALNRFGWRDIKSYCMPTNPDFNFGLLPQTSHLKNHDDHLHLQGYRPNITRTLAPRAPVIYLNLRR